MIDQLTTISSLNAWWELDLGASYDLAGIRIWNRTDDDEETFNKFYILISEEAFASTDLKETLEQKGVTSLYIEEEPETPGVYSLDTQGRYVRIQLEESAALHLAEVEVLGEFVAESTATPTATQTPTPESEANTSAFKLARALLLGGTIGEVGQLTNVDSYGVTVNLTNTYTNPVLIAEPGSFEGSDVALARITNVTSSSFSIEMAEPYSGVHGKQETISYLVIESGSYTLDDGTRVEANTVSTNASYGQNITDTWESVTFTNAFSGSIVVFSQIQTSNGQHYTDTRMKNIATTGFDVTMEDEEAATSTHATETIGWIAIDNGTGTWSGKSFEASTTSGSYSNSWTTLNFTNMYSSPRFLGMERGELYQDSIHLRIDNLDGNSVDLKVEEDQTDDSEVTTSGQVVNYMVIEGSGSLTGSTVTPTPTPTQTPTMTPTMTNTPTITNTPTNTATIDPSLPTATPTQDPLELPNNFGTASYTYDGDDTMVKSVIDGVTTYYVGGIYELIVEGTDETEVKYYYAASRRIAMRTVTDTTNTLHWLISDHLSSTTIITDESGTIVSEMKYTAFGEIRSMNGSSPTDYLYTGQRKEVEFGLSFYNSRWFDASLAHFISADTLIPQPGDSGNWDRYAYVLNNPLKYIDPSGHSFSGDDVYDPAVPPSATPDPRPGFSPTPIPVAPTMRTSTPVPMAASQKGRSNGPLTNVWEGFDLYGFVLEEMTDFIDPAIIKRTIYDYVQENLPYVTKIPVGIPGGYGITDELIEKSVKLRPVGYAIGDSSNAGLFVIGWGITILPSQLENISQKDTSFPAMASDLIVDTGGFVAGEIVGWVAGVVGGAAVGAATEGAGTPLGIVIKLSADVGVSIIYESQVDKYNFRETVYDWINKK